MTTITFKYPHGEIGQMYGTGGTPHQWKKWFEKNYQFEIIKVK